jgi:ComF family protein
MSSHRDRVRAIRAALRRGLDGALGLLLPPRCLGCGQTIDRQGRLCAGCWRGLTFLGPPLCRCCGYPLPSALPEAPLCGACAADPPAYDRARAALRYDDGARGLILRFKHADRTDVVPAFGAWLGRAGAELLAEAELVAPVPLHRWRLLRRGYNQAALLAQAVGRLNGVAVVPDLLQRIAATASQQGLSGRQRRANVTSGAFRVHPWHQGRVGGRAVLLIDDVLTTGATVSACARVLRRAGAARVDVLCLARVVRTGADSVDGPDGAAEPA